LFNLAAVVTPIPSDVGWHSVATMAAEAPYRVPLQFHFSRLQSLVKSKRNEAEDHIWLLREDPGYFRGITREFSEHRAARLPYERGRVDLGDRFWEYVFGRILSDAYSDLWVWHLVSKHIEKLTLLRKHYGERISPRRKLPVEYEEAFLHLSHLMTQIRNLPLQRFRHGIFASPPLRRHFYRERMGDPREVSVGRKQGGRKLDYFIWLIEQLAEEESLLRLGPKNILDELEHVVRTDSDTGSTRAKDRLSRYISSVLSDLAVAMEVDEAVAYHRPNVGFYTHCPQKL
jgi:hypothetical protein